MKGHDGSREPHLRCNPYSGLYDTGVTQMQTVKLTDCQNLWSGMGCYNVLG
ncbi:hypothetical protein D3C76_1863580 [compost metagenome]